MQFFPFYKNKHNSFVDCVTKIFVNFDPVAILAILPYPKKQEIWKFSQVLLNYPVCLTFLVQGNLTTDKDKVWSI